MLSALLDKLRNSIAAAGRVSARLSLRAARGTPGPALTWASRSAGLCSRFIAGAGQEGQDLADGAFPAVGLGERQVGLDLVAVAAGVLLVFDGPRPAAVGGAGR